MKLLLIAVFIGVSNAFMPSMPKLRHRSTNSIALDVATTSQSPNDFVFDELMSGDDFSSESTTTTKQIMDDEILDPDYRIAKGLACVGAALTGTEALSAVLGDASPLGFFGGVFHMILAGVVAFQTARVRCSFESDGFEFYNVDFERVRLQRKRGNWQTGLKNLWAYDKITNFRFFPSNDYPFLLYFKETQTPRGYWNENIAFLDVKGGGQPHIIPAIFNVDQFKAQLKSRGVKKLKD